MTLVAASIAVRHAEEVESAIERAEAAVKGGAKLIEWRIDALAEESDALEAVGELLRRSPAPTIITCRPAQEGGEYEGDEQARISLFLALAASKPNQPAERPRYIDLELAAYERSANRQQKIHLAIGHPEPRDDIATSLILSTHDFQGRPLDLLQRIEQMAGEPACSVIKIAWRARSLRDNLEAFELLAQRQKPMIAVCMGQFGLMSRVLAPKFGGFVTFASDSPAEATAPGQPTIDQLRNLYRFDRINAQTRVYGVIGWPVEHSQSPAIHNAGFEAVDHDGVYLPLPIPPEYEHFKATVGAMVDDPRLTFRGASVTAPHKQNLLRFVQERGGRFDPLTERIGAANTLVIGSAGGLECLNTDSAAAVATLCAGMSIDEHQLAGKRVAVLGAGGVARAVVAALSDLGATVAVFNRSAQRAGQLAADFNRRWTAAGTSAKVVAGKPESISCGCFDIFINCTSVGMIGGPAPDQSPLCGEVPLDDHVTVFDTVYAPARTPLIRQAEARGARTITGLAMFLRQAAMQFERWTGQTALTERFKTTVDSILLEGQE